MNKLKGISMRLGKLIQLFVTLTCLLLATTPVMASSITTVTPTVILNIVPSSSSTLTLAPYAGTYLTYTVSNNTSKTTIRQLIIDSNYGISNALLQLTVTNDHCTAASLSPGKSCTFDLLIRSTGASGSIKLMPKVCGFNGIPCSIPIEGNRVTVNVSTDHTPYMAIAVGNIASTEPLLAQSTGVSSTWGLPTISGISTTTTLLGAACIGHVCCCRTQFNPSFDCTDHQWRQHMGNCRSSQSSHQWNPYISCLLR
jgi:hypothetical protein